MKNKSVTYELPQFGITIEVNEGCGNISSTLKETANKDDWDKEQSYNCAIDGFESFLLALACEGYKIDSPRFIRAIQTAVDAIAHNF